MEGNLFLEVGVALDIFKPMLLAELSSFVRLNDSLKDMLLGNFRIPATLFKTSPGRISRKIPTQIGQGGHQGVQRNIRLPAGV